MYPDSWFAVWDVRLAMCSGFGTVCVDHERENTEKNSTRGEASLKDTCHSACCSYKNFYKSQLYGASICKSLIVFSI